MKYATSARNQQLPRPHGMIARTLNVQSIHTLHVKRNRGKKRKQIAPIVNIAERRKQNNGESPSCRVCGGAGHVHCIEGISNQTTDRNM